MSRAGQCLHKGWSAAPAASRGSLGGPGQSVLSLSPLGTAGAGAGPGSGSASRRPPPPLLSLLSSPISTFCSRPPPLSRSPFSSPAAGATPPTPFVGPLWAGLGSRRSGAGGGRGRPGSPGGAPVCLSVPAGDEGSQPGTAPALGSLSGGRGRGAAAPGDAALCR